MKCTNCSQEIKAGADFCDNCGAQAPPQATGNIPTKVSPVGTLQVPNYREFEKFAAICALAPFGLVAGILLVMNGDIYKKDQSAVGYMPVPQKLKTMTLAIGGAFNFAFYLFVLSVIS